MRTALFEGVVCWTCGNTANFERLDNLPHEAGTDYICICKARDSLFIKQYERQGGPL